MESLNTVVWSITKSITQLPLEDAVLIFETFRMLQSSNGAST